MNSFISCLLAGCPHCVQEEECSRKSPSSPAWWEQRCCRPACHSQISTPRSEASRWSLSTELRSCFFVCFLGFHWLRCHIWAQHWDFRCQCCLALFINVVKTNSSQNMATRWQHQSHRKHSDCCHLALKFLYFCVWYECECKLNVFILPFMCSSHES